MKPSDGYRLNRGYLLGTVIGAGLSLPCLFLHNPLWFVSTFIAVGGPIGWVVAFLKMGGDLD